MDTYAEIFLKESEQFHQWAKGKPPDRELYERKLVTISARLLQSLASDAAQRWTKEVSTPSEPLSL